MKWLDQLERKMGGAYIPNLMKYLALAMAGVFLLDYLPLPRSAAALLCFDRELILQGQIWRAVTFMVVPPTDGLLIWTLLRLYFYFFLGTALTRHWGDRKFNLYILIGWLSMLAGGMLVGYAAVEMLYSTLFLAFAMLYPEMELMLFFILPVKVKWLGWLSAASIVYGFIRYPGVYRLTILFAFVPFFLFFGRDCYLQIKLWVRHIRFWLTTRK